MPVYHLSDNDYPRDEVLESRKERVQPCKNRKDALEYFKSVVGKNLTFDEPSNGDLPAYWLFENPDEPYWSGQPIPVFEV